MSPTRARTTPWRDNIEALTVAVILAVVLKYFLIEAYKIPTGSMQPTLMGNEETGIFDRILVDKLSYKFREPKRYEVAVFKFPLDRSKNYVKRILGVGPEQVRIAHGDFWTRPDSSVPWRIPERSEPVLREMLKALDLGPQSEGRSSRWELDEGNEDAWRLEGRDLIGSQAGTLHFEHERHGGGSIRDHYLDGYPVGMVSEVVPKGPSGNQEVGDLRFEATVLPMDSLETLEVEFTEYRRTYTFTIPGPAFEGRPHPRIRATGIVDPTSYDLGAERIRRMPSAFRLSGARPAHLVIDNIDDRLRLSVDGETLGTLDIPPALRQRSSVRIRALGGGLELRDVQVYRDLYYITGPAGMGQLDVPDGHYFMLGDNTQDSSDGREWRMARKRIPNPTGVGTLDIRGGLRHQENPLTLSLPEGRTTFFRDEWGELHHYPATDEQSLGTERAPLVPRHLITGRALLVFWPYDRSRGVFRLRWVH